MKLTNLILASIAVIIICVLAIFAAVEQSNLNPTPNNPNPSATPATPVSLCAPKVGTFYYLWYGAPPASDWTPPKFIDYPVIGNYSSSDPAAIRQQLTQMQQAGIDFAVISWWGLDDDYGYGKFIENATKQVFETAKAINSPLQFAIMVEPFNSSYDYQEIYNHVWNSFVTPYSTSYYRQSGSPLICFFNNPNLTDKGNFPGDSRFTVITVGQQAYTQWIYTNLNYKDRPQHGPLNQTSVSARYDETNLPERLGHVVVDKYLNESTYDAEWQKAIQLWKEGKIDTIMISTWNEYPERTAIEPHYDGTSANPDPYYLFNETQNYISEIHSLADQ